MGYATALVEWARDLEPAMAFLFLLPFVVAGAALLQDYIEAPKTRESLPRATRAGASD